MGCLFYVCFMLIRQNLIPLSVETEQLRSQIVTLNVSPAQTYLPYDFTEQSATMLFSVLYSQRAIGVNLAIMRAFVQMQRVLEQNVELLSKIDDLKEGSGRAS